MRRVKPDLTLIADASVAPLEERCGWAGWCKGDGRGSVSSNGPLPWAASSTLAELRAIAAMLSYLDESGYIREADRAIMIQSDCQPALSQIYRHLPSARLQQHAESAAISTKKKRRRIGPGNHRAIKDIARVLERHNLTALIRHVRGHKAGDGRNWVNRECDRLAKLGRKQAIA